MRYLAFAIATAAVLGCGKSEPVAPKLADGSVYVLRTVQNATLPAVAISNPILSAKILADTIVLRADGTGSISALIQYTNVGQAPSEPYGYTQGFSFVLDGTQISIALNCPPLALCTQSPHFVGQVLPTGIRFDKALDYLVPLVYERNK